MVDRHGITRWEARSNGELEITVASQPLGMTKSFVWKNFTTNHYGQGSKWCWWYNETVDVTEKESNDLLTALVHDHDALRFLVHNFHIPPLTD